MKIQISTSAEKSGIDSQLKELKDDNTTEGTLIRNIFLGKESAFTYSGPRNFRTATPKPIPASYKRKYPDICFAIQALALHTGAHSYFREWEKAKKLLTFKTKENPRTLYRFWYLESSTYGSGLKESIINDLRNGKSIKLNDDEKYSSYTRNSKLFIKIDGHNVLAIATEQALQTNGRGTFLVTKHKLKPVFDIYWFMVALKNSSKKVFGTTKASIGDNYSQEREIIAESVASIRPEDVVGYYKNAQFFKIDDTILNVLGYDISPELIDQMKASIAKYGALDYSLFGNSLILTSILEKKPGSMYNYISDKSKIIEVPELTRILGMPIYAGIWR